MKHFHFINRIFAALLLFFALTIIAAAQPPNQLQETGSQPERPNLLRELDLSNQQIQRIRRLNQQRRPIMQESKRRLDEAIRALDEAIYADTEDEAAIQARIKDLQAAHSEHIKNRTVTEREIRRILTPEQLAKFRSLRAEFMQADNPGNRPLNRRNNLRNLRRRVPPKPSGNPSERRPLN